MASSRYGTRATACASGPIRAARRTYGIYVPLALPLVAAEHAMVNYQRPNDADQCDRLKGDENCKQHRYRIHLNLTPLGY